MQMEAAADRDVQFEAELRSFLRSEIARALANHLGDIRVEAVEGSRVKLRLLASCSSCYFRRGCIEGMILPELKSRFGDHYQFVIR